MKVVAPKIIQDVGVEIPSSKSISNRLLIIKALANSGEVENVSDAEDSLVLQRLLAEMPQKMDVGHAGTAFRFLTSYLSISSGTFVLTGSDRMKNRPISPLVNALRDLGSDIEYVEKEGFPPLRITGKPLLGGSVTVDSSISSQFISALMLIGPRLKNGLKISLSGDVVSRSYIEMTEKLMSSCGAQIVMTNSEIQISPSTYVFDVAIVEKDWSAISFWYELVLLGKIKHLLLKGVAEKSIQGDFYVLSLFSHFGVESIFDSEGLHLSYQKPETVKLQRIIDFKTTPDLIQPFVVSMTALNAMFVISGSKNLKFKETDRPLALKTELAKLGAFIDVAEDSILVMKGVDGVDGAGGKGVKIATYQDHRMAMAFAPLALIFGEIEIENPEVVQKSYPLYWEQLEKLGFTFV